ncbi:polysaccharide deacetylase family protein [Sporosarcina beigongshangi]|uniref:hypothetical protein n=1 Tax=Sporosarcina beigongshangi TaxID=2782538 RepID=UPI0019398B96|nr:hypothetical protein [Sporosarcina beigongshangi]
MRSKYFLVFIACLGLSLFLPPLPEQASLTSVFRLTDEPAVITRGTSGSVLTVNISFGDVEVEQWVQQLAKPYPLLFVDIDWAERFPSTVRLIREKNIPVGLLGHQGDAYEQDNSLFLTQLEQFETLFEVRPLWFRTVDEVFPQSLHTQLLEAEINALGSSIVWHGGDSPPIVEGEIISVPHHRDDHIVLTELKKVYKGRTFSTIEDMLFKTTVKTKKIPN